MESLTDCLQHMRQVFPEHEQADLCEAALRSSPREAVASALEEAHADVQEIEAAIREELGMP